MGVGLLGCVTLTFMLALRDHGRLSLLWMEYFDLTSMMEEFGCWDDAVR